MSQVDQLVEGALDHPEEAEPRLVLADWLEERGDDPSRARAELLRLQARRDQAGAAAGRALEQRAGEVLARHPGIVRPLEPLLLERAEVLALGPALAMVLTAPLTDVCDGPLAAGSTWRGHLLQSRYAFPTDFHLRRRDGNAVEGDMEEDFTSLHGHHILGRFFFRGVVVGRSRLLFVTYRTEAEGIHPGLYQLRLGHAGWLTGTWWVPGREWRADMRGDMRLRRRPAAGQA
jgi:uncharacterized protein (TIGR02996 family)